MKIRDINVLTNNIDKYGGLLILITGGIGNSITLLVLSQKTMKQFAVNICLVSMTTADLLHIVIGRAGRHMIRGFYNIDITSLSAVYCKIWYCIVSYPLIYSTYALVGKHFIFFALNILISFSLTCSNYRPFCIDSLTKFAFYDET